MNADPLRTALRDARRALRPGERLAAADGVADRLLALPFAPHTGAVAGYWAMDGELPLHSWQLRLPEGCTYCLPVLWAADDTLRFAPWRAGEALRNNRYGIPEPDVSDALLLRADQLALVAMPLTGFDVRGNRLGMGGGWYDRTFAFRQQHAPPPFLVGVGFDLQEVDALTPRSWDVRCDAIYTGTRTFITAETA